MEFRANVRSFAGVRDVDVIDLTLDPAEHEFVRKLSTEEAALEICRIHLRRVHRDVTFGAPSRGADLQVMLPDGTQFDLEVKGTEKVGVAWNQFKVSSQQCHDLLVTGIPVYRVTQIGSNSVRIFVLKHGIDFEMSHEPRWAVHAPRKRSQP